VRWTWLQSPAVALIELVASVIAVVQTIAWLGRCIRKLQTEATNDRYRGVRVAVALAAAVVVIAVSAFTWPVLIAYVLSSGSHRWIGPPLAASGPNLGVVALLYYFFFGRGVRAGRERKGDE
jgi:cytochrome bd-type quinol oxidase subunit 2